MVTLNINTSHGLVSGATGILKDFSCVCEESVIKWIKFITNNTGYITKQSNKNLYKNFDISIESNLIPILIITRNLKIRENSNFFLSRSQFPLGIAEAITIYKSLGST